LVQFRSPRGKSPKAICTPRALRTAFGETVRRRCRETAKGIRTMPAVKQFLTNEDGVTAIEYALVASLIAVFIVVAVQLLGTQLSTVFTEVGTSLK
jgi:pilus assembly protein Flp/PilA